MKTAVGADEPERREPTPAVAYASDDPNVTVTWPTPTGGDTAVMSWVVWSQ